MNRSHFRPNLRAPRLRTLTVVALLSSALPAAWSIETNSSSASSASSQLSTQTNGTSLSQGGLQQALQAEGMPSDTNQAESQLAQQFMAIAQAKGLDAAFVRDSGESDVAEVLLGQLGQEKAQNSQLKQFCQEMITAHTLSYSQLQPLAKKLTVEIPKATSLENAIAFLKVKSLRGSEFDQALALEFVKGHAASIGKSVKAQEYFKTPEAKMLATEEMPVLKRHFNEAVQLAKNLGLSDQVVQGAAQEKLEGVGAPGAISEAEGQSTGSGHSGPSQRPQQGR